MAQMWISRNSETFGPYDDAQVRSWVNDGTLGRDDLGWSEGKPWQPIGDYLRALPLSNADAATIRQIAEYERVSAILWMVIAIFQILSLVGIIAGVWNILAARSRFKIVPHIAARSRAVPEAFENIVGLIVIGVVNLLLGGLVGLLFVAFDFYIRDLVLKRRDLFTEEPLAAA